MMFDKTVLTLTLTLTLAACSTTAPKPDADSTDTTAEVAEDEKREGLTISGTVRAPEGAALEAPAKVVVLWFVDGESGDGVYKMGEGSLSGDTFEVTLPVLEPPRAALTNVSDFYLGVGMLVVVDGGLEIPEGMMGEGQLELIFEDGILGNSPRHAIIYREGSTEGIEGLEDLQWPNAFEEGALMCGAGVEREDGFAIFEPSRCDTIELIIGSREWINWT